MELLLLLLPDRNKEQETAEVRDPTVVYTLSLTVISHQDPAVFSFIFGFGRLRHYSLAAHLALLMPCLRALRALPVCTDLVLFVFFLFSSAHFVYGGDDVGDLDV